MGVDDVGFDGAPAREQATVGAEHAQVAGRVVAGKGFQERRHFRRAVGERPGERLEHGQQPRGVLQLALITGCDSMDECQRVGLRVA
jgi:hypothetical protein